MLVRIVSALIGIPVFMGLCLWGPAPFAAAAVVAAALGLAELLRTYRGRGLFPNPALAALGLLVPAWPLLRPLMQPYGPALPVAVLAGLVLAAFIWEVVLAGATGEMRAGANAGWGLLCGVYVALFGGMAVLRDDTSPAGSAWIPSLQAGAAWVLLAALCVWATDSMAYFTGRSLGRHKLAPKLSPGKTVEGAIGGLAGGVLVGAAFGHLLLGSAALGLAAGLAAGLVGQVGDLFESALKREACVKDFGSIMPGHGGILDRFDSLLFVAPVLAILAWAL